MPQSSYPLDITGINSANRVSNELRTVQIPTGPLAAFIVPTFAPFHGNTTYVTIKHGPIGNQTTLTYGVDYVFKHQFRHAKDQLDKDFYGSIMFLNRNLSGQVRITYNTIGGDYTLDSTQIIIDKTNSMLALQTVLWDQIVGVPVALPPTGHTHPPEDLLGWDDLITKMDEVIVALGDISGVSALVQTVKQMIEAHVADENNPHVTNKQKILLGNVQNYSIANAAESVDETNNTTYATPRTIWLMLNQKIEALVAPMLENLPVDAESLNLGNVQNYGVATNAEAYGGSASKYIVASNANSLVGGQMVAIALGDATRTRATTHQRVQLSTSHPDHPGLTEISGPVIVDRNRLPASDGWLETAYPKDGTSLGSWRRVVTVSTSPTWVRFTYGLASGSASWGDDPKTGVSLSGIRESLTAGLNRTAAVTNHALLKDRIEAQFLYKGALAGVTAGVAGQPWRVQNVYYSALTTAPAAGTPRCQVATMMPPEDIVSNGTTYTPAVYIRYVAGNDASVWQSVTADVGNVPDWQAATTPDMVYNTTVSDKFVAPVNVKEHVDSRLGTFIQRVTVSDSLPSETGARLGDVHFQIV